MANDDIQGTITDEAGNPISGAVVALIPDEGNSGDNVLYTKTNANGAFLFDGHPQGDGTSKLWHLAASWEDGSGGYNTHSKPDVSAALPEGGTIPDSVVDNFEDSNLTEYTLFTNNWETRTTNVPEGSVAFGNSSDAGQDGLIYSLEGDGLNYYPQKGDKFSCLLRETPSAENNLPSAFFGLFDDNGTVRGYGVTHFPANNQASVIEIADNSYTVLEFTRPSLSRGVWYDYEVEWHDGSGSEPDNEIVLTVYEVDTNLDLSSEVGHTSEVASIQVNDSQYPAGRGVGFGNFTSSQQAATIADRYWNLGNVE